MRGPQRSTRANTLLPYTTLLRSGPGAGHAGEHLLGRGLADETLVLGDVGHRLVVGLGAPQPGRHVVLGHALGLQRQAALAEIRSEEHTSELQSLMRISYAVFCLKKKKPQLHCITP